jgi:hypothetical protein
MFRYRMGAIIRESSRWLVLSKWPVVCATVTHTPIKISVETQERAPKKYAVPVDQTKVAQHSVTFPYTSASLLMYENWCAALGQCSFIQ